MLPGVVLIVASVKGLVRLGYLFGLSRKRWRMSWKNYTILKQEWILKVPHLSLLMKKLIMRILFADFLHQLLVLKMETDLSKVEDILNRYEKDKSQTIGILQDVQKEFNYLPREALIAVSEGLQTPLSEIFGIATFYKSFSLIPRGRHLIQVCLGTACHVRGGKRVLELVERDLDIKEGETTPNLRFSLESVNCLGACALGPVMVVDGKYFGHVKLDKVENILKDYE